MAAEVAILSNLSKLLSFHCKIISKQNKEYTTKINQYWNGSLRIYEPLAFVEVTMTKDIVIVAKFCIQTKIDFCVRSGGNGNYSAIENSIVIDMIQLNKVQVDVKNKTVNVQSGARIGDIDAATTAHNLATPLGTASFIGAGGHLLDLGMGVLSRSYGFAIDNILEYNMVLADGESVKVICETHPDLFWAMKGYGANFGIVTDITMRLYEIPPLIAAGHCYFAFKDARIVLKHMRDFQDRINDPKLAIYGMLNTTEESMHCFWRFIYNGDVEKGMKYSKELMNSCPVQALFSNIGHLTYQSFQSMADNLFCPGKFCFLDPGYFFTDLNDDVINLAVDTFSNLTPEHNAYSVGYIVPLGSAVSEVPEKTAPFLLRKSRYWVGTVGTSSTLGQYETMQKMICQGTSTIELLADKIMPEKAAAIADKLALIKRQYDPNNIFRHCAVNIIPAGNNIDERETRESK